MKPEPSIETVNQIPTVGKGNESEVLPVCKRKNKAAFLIGFIPLLYVCIHSTFWTSIRRIFVNNETIVNLQNYSIYIEFLTAVVLVYVTATSKADSKTVIRNVLLGTVAYAIASLIIWSIVVM